MDTPYTPCSMLTFVSVCCGTGKEARITTSILKRLGDCGHLTFGHRGGVYFVQWEVFHKEYACWLGAPMWRIWQVPQGIPLSPLLREMEFEIQQFLDDVEDLPF